MFDMAVLSPLAEKLINADGSAEFIPEEDARLRAWYDSDYNPKLMKIWYKSSYIITYPGWNQLGPSWPEYRCWIGMDESVV